MVTEIKRDGVSTFLHLAYATSDKGENFSLEEFEGATYKGRYANTTAIESSNYKDYIWEQIAGFGETEKATPKNSSEPDYALLGAVRTSETTSTNYITASEVIDGDTSTTQTKLHQEGDDTNNVTINASSVEIIKDSEKVAEFGETISIGTSDNARTEITNNGIIVYEPAYAGSNVVAMFTYGEVRDGYNERGYGTWAQIGENVNAGVIAGHGSMAEGIGTKATGAGAHAEGKASHAGGAYSHAEGVGTRAYYVDGEGIGTGYVGNHAEGIRTIASYPAQHVEGKYNIEDTENKYAHIIGNGDGDANRSNALTVDWSGNLWTAGTITDGNGNVLGAGGGGIDTDTFKIKEFKKDNISIAGSGDSENTINVALAGYTPISSLGFRVMNASSSGVGSSYANVYRADIVPASNQFVVYARNIRTSAIKVAVNVRILYIKSEFISL